MKNDEEKTTDKFSVKTDATTLSKAAQFAAKVKKEKKNVDSDK